MSKYTGPTMKRVRRLGEEYAMGGDRALATKYVKLHRKQPPGVHGKRRSFAKTTGYGKQLLEKQKARFYYFLTEKQLANYYRQATRQTDSTDVALIVGLERRFDNVLYRSGFADSHANARQLAGHAHFLLNGRKVDVPSIQVRPGDKITFSGKRQPLADQLRELAQANHSQVPSWLKVDPKTLSIEVVALPTRDEIEVPFNEKLVIEFYSR
jgi:small subunit ribosomal protein S4